MLAVKRSRAGTVVKYPFAFRVKVELRVLNVQRCTRGNYECLGTTMPWYYYVVIDTGLAVRGPSVVSKSFSSSAPWSSLSHQLVECFFCVGLGMEHCV